MGMLYDALMLLVRTAVILVQLIVGGILLSAVWVPIALIVGALNILLVMVTGSGFDRIDLLTEPLKWYAHQAMALVDPSMDFWAIPYAGM